VTLSSALRGQWRRALHERLRVIEMAQAISGTRAAVWWSITDDGILFVFVSGFFIFVVVQQFAANKTKQKQKSDQSDSGKRRAERRWYVIGNANDDDDGKIIIIIIIAEMTAFDSHDRCFVLFLQS
jgi:hypothetical protein